MDQLIARQFGLHYDDKAAKPYTDWSFGKKLQFLKEKGIFSSAEYDKLKEWKDFRNRLFHDEETHYFIWEESKKEKFMDDAIKATHIIRDALVKKQ